MAGSLVMQAAQKAGVEILPVDSEHNAIYQALQGNRQRDLSHIVLTASGGPFLDLPKEEFKNITKAQALKHPNWEMGPKITIDSASMMNKALEIIEARWLFNLKPEEIKVVVHKQSIIHSLVAYRDGSLIAQLGQPDMRVPIAHCLAWPERIESGVEPLDLAKVARLDFQEPDLTRFPSLDYAYRAIQLGGGAPAALNGANEELVDLFLREKIPFLTILQDLGELMTRLETEEEGFPYQLTDLNDALQADQWGRNFITERHS